MLIGLLGGKSTHRTRQAGLLTCLQDICAGKHAVADYLVTFEGFTLISMPPKDSHGSLGTCTIPEQDIIDRVTKDSQKRWVTVINGRYEYILQAFLGRPFFLLVYIDAPLLTRWIRYKDRYAQGCFPSHRKLTVGQMLCKRRSTAKH